MIMDEVDRKQLELLHSLSGEVTSKLKILTEIDKIWQPTDYLPDFTSNDWRDQVEAFRKDAQNIPDDLLVVLVGDMITEEALPNYSVSLNVIAQDTAGEQTPWARWLRGWTAEENRHGDLLNAYLRLTGRVDIRKVEVTVQYLIANGFNPKSFPEPYNGLVYTSFQERATRISHQNVAKLAAAHGDPRLALICNRIAGDEARHENFYSDMMGLVFDQDPNGAMLSFRTMLRTLIAMPGKNMYDGVEPKLFDNFSVVAQRTGVYTILDYAQIIDHLLTKWRVADRSVSGDAAKAQNYVCKQAERYRGLADRIAETINEQPKAPFSWIYGRQA